MILFIAMFILLFFPEISFAWGPLTHAYLAQQLFSFPELISAGVLPIITFYRDYFLYGSILPDIVIGKRYLPEEKNLHSWKTALTLFDKANTSEEKSFAHGYLAHLAADAVLHNDIRNLSTIQHAFFEFKADRAIDRYYWIQIMSINKKVKKISEKFFEKAVTPTFFSIKTNTKIYKSFIFLSAFNLRDFKNAKLFEQLHLKSLSAMIDLLNSRENSKILELPPNF